MSENIVDLVSVGEVADTGGDCPKEDLDEPGSVVAESGGTSYVDKGEDGLVEAGDIHNEGGSPLFERPPP